MERVCVELDEAKAEIEKLRAEHKAKVELYEVSTTKQMYEELKASMKEKEAIIKNLGSLNDKLRGNCNEKMRKWEEEKQELLVALDEANSKNMDQEQNFVHRDDMLDKQEEENRKVEDQLKWKKEQFKHLEEAYEKLRNQLQACTKEWEREKSTLFDEISTLQSNLDSQTRISEDLQSRLRMCNQALAHEESRKEVSGSSAILQNLRDVLGTKEMIHKEMKYQLGRLEQENQELRFSVKELQEAQIQEAGNSSSLSKLRNKLKGLEQIHRDCSKNLRAIEAEWTAKFDKMAGDLSDCRSELEGKDRDINKLKMKLGDYRSLIMHLELQDEEKSLTLLVLKLVISEAQLKLADEIANMNRRTCEREAEVSLLRKQLEMKRAALAQKSIAEDHEQQLRLQDELERHEEMLKESWESQLHLEEKGLQMEIDLVKVRDALNRANDELAEKFCERNELEFELQIWRSTAERLKANLEENHQLRKQVEELQDEEKSLMLLVLKSVISEAQLKLADEIADMDRRTCEREAEVSLLRKQLEMKHAALVKAQKSIAEDHEQQLRLQDELERHKEMLKESWESQLRLKEKALQMEIDLVKVRDALNRANDELAEKFCERNELEFELQIWRSIAERLKANLEENHQLRKQVEVSLLADVEVEVTLKQEKDSLGRAVEEKDRRIDDLESRIVSLDRKLNAREREKEKEKISSDHQREVECLEQECVRRELEGAILAHIDAERIYEHERENFHSLVEQRNQRIDDIHQLLGSLEEKFKSSTTSFSLQLAEKEAEVNLLHKAWEKIAADEVLKEIEIQEQRLVIEELEDDFQKLRDETGRRRPRLICSTKLGRRLQQDEVLKEIEIQEQRLVIEELEDDFRNLEMKLESLQKTFSRSKDESEKMVSDLRTSNTVIDKLESEKRTLVEDVKKLSSDRESLLDFIGNMSERICEFSIEDMQLMGVWERIQRKLKGDDELFKPSKENMNIHPTSTTKRVEATLDERSPLRALNN
ncbi:transcription factor bHLH131-like protein [Actinidia rufa]|uniref:Transcription factor bHLH131-like protein n=1 Tax=Actinidia rufa TaxID=165716 RepID=A0A7J0EN26_9ERIC|nr:transcription factor bHLH131-like protein [Actinidia rufa]